jgi:hypothetical protein
MAFEFRKCLGGGTVETYDDILVSNVAITKGQLLYNNVGYLTNATAATCTTQTVVGVAGETVDNSGGSAGDKDCAVIVNLDAIFEVGTGDTMLAAYVWFNVAVATGMVTVTSATDKTADNSIGGPCQIRKLISASKVLVRINHFSTGE